MRAINKNPEKMSKRFFSILFLGISVATMGQDYQWQAKLDSITTDGFYKIQLPPAVISKLKSGMNDLRIMDAQNKEVPYILQKATPKPDSLLFKEYKIMSLENAKKHTTLILQNADKNRIDNIQLVIKNADVSKSLRLSGSDDMKQWYVIKDNYYITDVYSNTGTSTVRIFDFPNSDYEYFKIEIDDSLSPPIKILKAGYYDTYKEDAKYSELPSPTIMQVDSSTTFEDGSKAKGSFIKLTYNEPQTIDKMIFEVDGPRYYHRNCYSGVIVEKPRSTPTKKYFDPSEEFILSSNGDNTIYFSLHNIKELWFNIRNDDNQPLQVKGIKAYQITNSLIAYMQKGKSYKLVFGADKISAPVYDLVHFKDSIAGVKPVALGAIASIAQTKATAVNTAPSNKAIIWAALAVVLILLGVMSTRMIKEMGKKG